MNERQARPLAQLLTKHRADLIPVVVDRARELAKEADAPLNSNHIADATDEALAEIALNESLDAMKDLEPSKRLAMADRFITGDSRTVQLPKKVNVVVCSPRYNTNLDYGNGYNDNTPYEVYISELRNCFENIVPQVEHEGRLCINVADIGTAKDETAQDAIRTIDLRVIDIMKNLDCHLLNRHIWNRGKASGRMKNYCGSFGSPRIPKSVRMHEYVLIFGKGSVERTNVEPVTSNRLKWREAIGSAWNFQAETRKIGGHSCQFPVELPLRCLTLYAARGDVVADFFGGVGTTAVAAQKLGLEFFSIDQNERWNIVARKRLDREMKKKTKGEKKGGK